MPPARPPRLLALAVAAAAVLAVLGAPPATAEEPSAPAAPAAPAAPDAPAPGDAIVGELVQGYVDPSPSAALETDEDHADSLVSWIETGAGDAVRVPTADVEDIETGATVEVTLGGAVADEVAAADLAPAQEVLAAEVLAAPAEATAPADGTVNHLVTVVMLQPADAVLDGTTLAQVVDTINGPVASFWAEQTGGAVRIGVGPTFDWTTRSTVDCSDPFALWSEAATRAGWQPAPGRHLLVYVPADSPGCGYGLGTIGTGIGSGGMSYVQAPELSVIAHEIGHNLGLGHASELLCDGTLDRGACAVSEYFDLYDVMGISWGPVGSLNAPHAARLGVLPSGAVPTIRAGAPPAQYVLAPVGARTGTRALRLVDTDGEVYWLEYRTPTGRDSWLETHENWVYLQTGVQVRLTADGNDTSLLLDATPSRMADWGNDLHVALPGMDRVAFGAGPFHVTVLESRAGFARLEVSTAGPYALTVIEHHYMAHGGMAGWLGAPVEHEFCGLPWGGCRRAYQNGSLYWNPRTPSVSVMSAPTAARYESAGGPAVLGYPHADERQTNAPGGAGRITSFPGGDIVWTPSTGARLVRGAILARWRASGAEHGPLGYPTGDDAAVAGGFKTDFAGGSIYWSAATGARMVRGAILQRYVAAGGPAALGFPIADDGGTADGTGALVRLQGGVIYWSARTGAHDVRGAILERWRSLGAQTGVLGYPTGDDTAVPGGWKTDFAGGSVYWSPSTGARVVRGGILSHWLQQGGPTGALGFPLTDHAALPDGGGWQVRFQHGTLVERLDGTVETTTG